MYKLSLILVLVTLCTGCVGLELSPKSNRFAHNKQTFSQQIFEADKPIKKSIPNELKANSLSRGMTKITVKTLMGEPNDVQIAGNSSYENEKWIYQRYIPTEAGYQKDIKIIYFEKGKVAGWE